MALCMKGLCLSPKLIPIFPIISSKKYIHVRNIINEDVYRRQFKPTRELDKKEHPMYEHNPPTDIWAVNSSTKYTQFEKVEGHWHFVERLIPPTLVPEPPKHEATPPSGWKPSTGKAPDLPYYVGRTRNHMLPVYLKKEISGPRFLTKIKNIQGDLWALEKEIKTLLEEKYKKMVITKVNEAACYIYFKGDHVKELKELLLHKGF